MLEEYIETLLNPIKVDVMKISKEVLDNLDLVYENSPNSVKMIINDFREDLEKLSLIADRRVKRNKLKKIKLKYVVKLKNI